MTDTYNNAAEMVLQYMDGHAAAFEGIGYDKNIPFPYDQVTAKQPLLKKIVAVVADKLNYELSEFQCSWAVFVFFGCGLAGYNKGNGLDLPSLTLSSEAD